MDKDKTLIYKVKCVETLKKAMERCSSTFVTALYEFGEVKNKPDKLNIWEVKADTYEECIQVS